MMWRIAIVLGVAIVGLAVYAPPSVAYPSLSPTTSVDPARTECTDCHGSGEIDKIGPHGGYTTTTNKCSVCHSVHNAQSGLVLLPKQTIKATCESCHDGTGGDGVYGVLEARGVTVGASHRIDVTNLIPGGEASTGQTRTVEFTGDAGTMGCDDCHSPHGGNSPSLTVEPFIGDRVRVSPDETVTASSHLLLQMPTGATTATAEYGSDWCGACHQGRLRAYEPTEHAANHPVDTIESTTTPFTFNSLSIMATDAVTSSTVMGSLGRSNLGYLMLDPRPTTQGDHRPICQQCHGNARDPGSLVDTGTAADVATYSVTATGGTGASDNPRFQVFPHEAENANFLIETGDDLCTNCHAVLE